MIYSFSNITSYSTFSVFYSWFSGNIMADVASKQQTIVLFLSTIIARTRRHTELTNLMGNLCSVRDNQFSISCSFFNTVQLHRLTYMFCMKVSPSAFLKLRLAQIIFKASVPTQQRTQCVSFRKTNQLVLFREVTTRTVLGYWHAYILCLLDRASSW